MGAWTTWQRGSRDAAPGRNISNADTRWDLIENDTLTAFQELIENDPERVEEILSATSRSVSTMPGFTTTLTAWWIASLTSRSMSDGGLW